MKAILSSFALLLLFAKGKASFFNFQPKSNNIWTLPQDGGFYSVDLALAKAKGFGEFDFGFGSIYDSTFDNSVYVDKYGLHAYSYFRFLIYAEVLDSWDYQIEFAFEPAYIAPYIQVLKYSMDEGNVHVDLGAERNI